MCDLMSSCLVAVSMFNVIQFPNDECEGDTGKNGTCYTGEVEMDFFK